MKVCQSVPRLTITKIGLSFHTLVQWNFLAALAIHLFCLVCLLAFEIYSSPGLQHEASPLLMIHLHHAKILFATTLLNFVFPVIDSIPLFTRICFS